MDVDADTSMDSAVGLYKEAKLLVFKRCLYEILGSCPVCNGFCEVTEAKAMGTFRAFRIDCSRCEYERSWSTQPFVCGIPAGNISLSAAINFSGACPAKFLRALDMMNVASISYSTFYNHSRLYIHPTIYSFWKEHQQTLINTLAQMNGGLVLAGDARSDSPGHCAKYNSYTMLESRINRVIDMQLVQVHFPQIVVSNMLIYYFLSILIVLLLCMFLLVLMCMFMFVLCSC